MDNHYGRHYVIHESHSKCNAAGGGLWKKSLTHEIKCFLKNTHYTYVLECIKYRLKRDGEHVHINFLSVTKMVKKEAWPKCYH